MYSHNLIELLLVYAKSTKYRIKGNDQFQIKWNYFFIIKKVLIELLGYLRAIYDRVSEQTLTLKIGRCSGRGT